MLWNAIKFLLVLAILPAQYYISAWLAPSDLRSSRNLRDGGYGLVRDIEQNLYQFESYVQTKFSYLHRLGKGRMWGVGGGLSSDDLGESPAIEVIKHDYYGKGLRTRKDRSRVAYRLGQLMRHKHTGFNCIVVGWDEEGLAPDDWFQERNVAAKERNQPYYRVILDQSAGKEYEYFPQSDLVPVNDPALRRSFQSSHLGYFFENYHENMGHFVAKRWLRKLYPKD